MPSFVMVPAKAALADAAATARGVALLYVSHRLPEVFAIADRITGSYTAGAGMGGVELTSAAFASVFPWFPYVLALAVIGLTVVASLVVVAVKLASPDYFIPGYPSIIITIVFFGGVGTMAANISTTAPVQLSSSSALRVLTTRSGCTPHR